MTAILHFKRFLLLFSTAAFDCLRPPNIYKWKKEAEFHSCGLADFLNLGEVIA